MTVVDEIYEKPLTWDDAAARVVFEILEFNISNMNKLEDMRAQLDYMISRNINNSNDAWMANDEMADFWKILAAITRAAAGESKITFFGFNPAQLAAEEIRKLGNSLSGLVVRKQRDYGSDNILRFGRMGLLVRVHDKIARLENLVARGTEPNNESLSDNYMDVIGYCTVAILFERGWFTLPLEKQ